MQFHKLFFIPFAVLLLFVSCKEEQLPKPASYLRLDYRTAQYNMLVGNLPFEFRYNSGAKIHLKKNNWIDVEYPNMKATLVLTYSPVKNNLRELFKDAENLTFKHMIKADDIQAMPFENRDRKVYGKMFEVYGNAATQIQFHATDSTDNFLTGALYFYAKPNYDSILPAVHYLRKDIVQLMETLSWKK
ncbi:gliding motility lipoprotein GldD [Flavicella sediminum]|uniref:gliding motility lipoprotein GldD n=1 Tax=Flavicella sediminum TaxID=2585141 RepID=UPI001121B2B0|nr:gliding motility lipoprotein GldD [Flavicella sediminum]